MTNFDRGDVVLVDFPFTDLSASKVRPALVVSSDFFHESGLDVILVAITSRTQKEKLPSDFLLSPEDQRHAGLPRRSLVRLGKIFTLDRRLIGKKLGHIPENTLTQLTSILHRAISRELRNEDRPFAQEPRAIYKAGKPKGKPKTGPGKRKGNPSRDVTVRSSNRSGRRR